MPAELLGEVPTRALAIYAHPDDSDVSCGGTLAAWAAAGSEVHVVICATGDKGGAGELDEDELVGRRRGELAAAAALLGLTGVHLLAHRDGELDNDLELRQELVAVIRAVRPEVLVCPDPLAVFFGEHYYNHRDHREVGFAALDAASPAASSPRYFPSAGEPFAPQVAYLSGTLEPAVYVDISATIALKTEAISCHTSQLGDTVEWFRDVVAERAEQAGRAVGVAFAEAFRRIRLGQ